MAVKILKDSRNTIAFFPESLRYFQVDEFFADIVGDLNKGLSFDELSKKHKLPLEKIKELSEFVDEKSSILIDTNRVINSKYLTRLSINITNTCNMKCDYCYANFGNYGDKNCLMSLDLLRETLDKFYQEYEEIGIIQLFGGEPLINLKAVEFVGQYIENKFNNKEIIHKTQIGIVTNGTIATKKAIELINKYDIKVTVSIDGPRNIQDEHRHFLNGSGTYDIVFNNIKKMREQTQNQPFALEVTYNQQHIEMGYSIVDIIKFFEESLGHFSYHIEPVSDGKNTCLGLKSSKAFVESVAAIFDDKRYTHDRV